MRVYGVSRLLSRLGIRGVTSTLSDAFLTLCRGRPSDRQIGLLKGPPFEVLLVTTTGNLSPVALVTSGFGLVALEPLRLTGDAT